MNRVLHETIHAQLSGNCNTYFYQLPNKELLGKKTVVWSLKNVRNNSTFENNEAVKEYLLQVNLNSPSINDLINADTYKNQVNKLVGKADIKVVSLIDEELFFDDELKIWTEIIVYELQVS